MGDLIDIHTHLGEVIYGDPRRRPLTAQQLVDTMNRIGIDKSVLLPLDSPEASDAYFTVDAALRARDMFPERLIPFCCVDPRRSNPKRRIERYKEMGCVGFGEHKVGMPIDDPRNVEIYRICGELGLPVLIHMDHLIRPRLNWDEPGLPRLRRLAEELPDTIFIMHGPGWWSEISAEVEEGVGYPKGPVKRGGAADLILQECPNVYADLSAGSGYNALTRDPEFTKEFLERNWNKLLFGTDYLHAGQPLPIVDLIHKLPIDEEKARAIRCENAKKLLKL
ncbi:TPA: amidohydrolase [Candidatus Poribacteria bacterium]|nr:amidohydrolase [Candidatus Poribacteria bacterium]HEX30169.1 amidohydrolase [Candidatus Poribacteria bacterium]